MAHRLKPAKVGMCRLTGTVGRFVKSHITPDAFMRRASEAPFMEWSGDGFPKKAFSGWYDNGIVTREGEDLLSKLDDAAAKCFIDRGFTYRSRRDPTDNTVLRDTLAPCQIYEIPDVNSGILRLFGLSLLWRSAVSTQEAFKDIRVSPSHLEDLRRRILLNKSEPYTEFPVYFGVFCSSLELTKVAPYKPKNYPFYRFFLDGVICYVSPRRRVKTAEEYGSLLAGAEADRLRLICFPSLEAHQARYQDDLAVELFEKHGDVFAGFKGASRR